MSVDRHLSEPPDPAQSLLRLPDVRRLLLVSMMLGCRASSSPWPRCRRGPTGGTGQATAGLVTTVMLVTTVAIQGLVPITIRRFGSGLALALGLVLLGAPAPLYAAERPTPVAPGRLRLPRRRVRTADRHRRDAGRQVAPPPGAGSRSGCTAWPSRAEPDRPPRRRRAHHERSLRGRRRPRRVPAPSDPVSPCASAGDRTRTPSPPPARAP